MDSHNVQRYVTAEGYVQNEVNIGVHPRKPYKILTGRSSQKEECVKRWFSCLSSSSHIALLIR